MNTIWLPMLTQLGGKGDRAAVWRIARLPPRTCVFPGADSGDFLIGCLWPIIGWWLKVNTYSFSQ
jgi:hypothetical protein